jgi:hypothetical protein
MKNDGTAWDEGYGVTSQLVDSNPDPGKGVTYSAVSGPLFGANGPSYLDVQQGDVGDCWLLASLAEVAARNQADIESMFTQIDATHYAVRFFNNFNGVGVAKYVVVDTELPLGGTLYDYAANGPMWVALAEKAYAEANFAGWVTTNAPGSDSYNALNNGDPSWALHAITDVSTSVVGIDPYDTNPAYITTAWSGGVFMVLTSSPTHLSPFIVGGQTKSAAGVVNEVHSYAIVNYFASSNSFLVFNPWGTDFSSVPQGSLSPGVSSALYATNNHPFYGLFTANATFLTQNFQGQSDGDYPVRVGSANVVEAGIHDVGNSSQEVASISDTNASLCTPSTHNCPQADRSHEVAVVTAAKAQPQSRFVVDSLFAAWDYSAGDQFSDLPLFSAEEHDLRLLS